MSHALAPVGKKWVWRGDDFPAWLSPMLVKELRQGIQSGAFAWTFIGLQVVMFLLMAWTTAWIDDSGNFASAVRTMSGVFWAAVGVAMAVVVPLQGLGAIAAERSGNNLDLVRLTHLSATRIVTGKWLALVAQAFLLATAALPYLVLRYFLGGVEVLDDLETFAWLAGASMLVAAAAIALSTLPQWLRIAACVMLPGVAFAGLELLDDVISTPLRMSAISPVAKLGLMALLATYGVACLEFAAGRIAPAAENHAARKRLLALGLATAWLAVSASGSQEAVIVMLVSMTPLLLCYAVGALVERPSGIPTVVAPFARAGVAGRLAALLFAPGWATGLVFVTILWAACATGITVTTTRFSHDAAEAVPIGLTLAGLVAATLVFPLPIIVRLPRVSVPLLLYVLVHLVSFMVFVWSGAAWSEMGSESAWWPVVLPMPLAALLAYAALNGGSEMTRLAPVFGGAAAGTLAIACLAVAGPWIREIRGLGRLVTADSTGRRG